VKEDVEENERRKRGANADEEALLMVGIVRAAVEEGRARGVWLGRLLLLDVTIQV
jgi:hypothetical protein